LAFPASASWVRAPTTSRRRCERSVLPPSRAIPPDTRGRRYVPVVTRQRIARALFAVTALAVLVGLIVQVQVSAGLKGTQFTSTSSLVFNVFCYFTVQSNIIVGATAALLAVRLDHPSTVFRVFRLAGLIAIAITFVVFHLALAHLQDLRGAAAFADGLLHTVVPVLAVSGWLMFGPRRAISWRIAALAVLFPLCWVAFALVRGADRLLRLPLHRRTRPGLCARARQRRPHRPALLRPRRCGADARPTPAPGGTRRSRVATSR